MRQLDAGWYAVQVRSQSEKMVAALLKYKGYESFLPTYSALAAKKRNPEGKPLFSGYVFCRAGHNSSGLIVTTPGVIQILGCGNVPQPVPDFEIDNLKLVLATGAPVRPWPQVETGMRARLIEGPLRGCTGIVVKVDNETHLVVTVELLQRSVSVRMEREWVEAISPISKAPSRIFDYGLRSA